MHLCLCVCLRVCVRARVYVCMRSRVYVCVRACLPSLTDSRPSPPRNPHAPNLPRTHRTDMRTRGEVNPYIKLLHQWQKEHELERKSGNGL